MDPTCSAEGPAQGLSQQERVTLLAMARASIAHGVEHGEALSPSLRDVSHALAQERACFVTLEHLGALRGCVGTLVARLPLVAEVARSAFSAAFRDPRFGPVARAELAGLVVHISVLSQPEAMAVESEQRLLELLRPGVDGVTLREGSLSGTFLPVVWEKIREPRRFLDELRAKAGLPRGYWSSTLQVERYTTESFP